MRDRLRHFRRLVQNLLVGYTAFISRMPALWHPISDLRRCTFFLRLRCFLGKTLHEACRKPDVSIRALSARHNRCHAGINYRPCRCHSANKRHFRLFRTVPIKREPSNVPRRESFSLVRFARRSSAYPDCACAGVRRIISSVVNRAVE
jgi:hypothetical protein